LVFVGRHKVRRLGRIEYLAELSGPTAVSPAQSAHSRFGVVTAKLSRADGETVVLEPGDTLAVEFAAAAPEEGLVRDWFVVAHGSYSSSPSQTSGGVAKPASGPPPALALGAARPNPSQGAVMIPFSLPNEREVTLRLYDVSGRLVRTLLTGRRPAGEHDVLWDARSDAGSRAPQGVYFYRLQADDWVSQRKVVLLSR
jgi:hypothetical protein